MSCILCFSGSAFRQIGYPHPPRRPSSLTTAAALVITYSHCNYNVHFSIHLVNDPGSIYIWVQTRDIENGRYGWLGDTPCGKPLLLARSPLIEGNRVPPARRSYLPRVGSSRFSGISYNERFTDGFSPRTLMRRAEVRFQALMG